MKTKQPIILTLAGIVERAEKHRCVSDQRRRTVYVLASYRCSEGHEYRKSFESYSTPVVPERGTHAEINALKTQF